MKEIYNIANTMDLNSSCRIKLNQSDVANKLMKINVCKDIWESLSDTPEEFEDAIKNAVSLREKEFYEKLLYKILHETAFSNDVLLKDDENDEGIYILRVGTDGVMVGRDSNIAGKPGKCVELSGICFAMNFDMFDFLGHHITLRNWLRNRDYKGIRYDRNNDCQ